MIKVKHSGSTDPREKEPCCSCGKPTHYWYEPKDVACCHLCAPDLDPFLVPSKRDWLNSQLEPGEKPLPAGWTCAADRRAREIATLRLEAMHPRKGYKARQTLEGMP